MTENLSNTRLTHDLQSWKPTVAQTEVPLILITVKTERNSALKQNNKTRWGQIFGLM